MTRTPWKSEDWIEPQWTDRQTDVLRLIARGRTNPEIAEDLGIAFASAKWYVSEVLSKLGVLSREDAAAYWHWRISLRTRAGRGVGRLAALAMVKAVWAGAAVTVAGAAGIVIGVAFLVAPGSESPPSDLAVVVSTATATATSETNRPTPAVESGDDYLTRLANASTGVISESQTALLASSESVGEAYSRLPELMIPCLAEKGLTVITVTKDIIGRLDFIHTWAGEPGVLP